MKCPVCKATMVRPISDWYCPNEDNHQPLIAPAEYEKQIEKLRNIIDEANRPIQVGDRVQIDCTNENMKMTAKWFFQDRIGIVHRQIDADTYYVILDDGGADGMSPFKSSSLTVL